MFKSKWFTFKEILVAIAIIVLVTLITYPKFVNTIRKSHEVKTRANLFSLRNAVAIYYGENEGHFPGADIAKVLTSDDKYLKYIPEVYCPPYHPPTTEITTSPTGDSGKWAYQVEDSDTRQAGEIWIDCNHKDTRDVSWDQY